MRNVFLLYIPPSNREAVIHYEDTIKNKVSLDRIARYLSKNDVAQLRNIFGAKRIAVWGSRDSSANRARFEKMAPGDDLLIVEGATIKLLGKVGLKVESSDLSRELWKHINAPSGADWKLIYCIANPVEIGVPFAEFCRVFGYEENYQLRGFTTVEGKRLARFYEAYDDVYSILLRVKAGQRVLKKPETAKPVMPVAAQAEATTLPGATESPSDHIKMQWTLARLGKKAGEKVWVPTNDQGRLREIYSFDEFEAEFTSGIDLPKNYVENIDVVWKEEFRIRAAFEVENSTAIYSGLLRFADLNTYAPNSPYPMFIVAPADRRNKVRDQLLRPSFGKLELRDKVRFLSYETVDEIDSFFARASSGVSVDLIQSKAEALV